VKQRIYIDTSVIGGCFDKEFEEWSNTLLNEFIVGNKIAIISDITIDELENAPEKVQKIISKIPDENLFVLESDSESENLLIYI